MDEDLIHKVLTEQACCNAPSPPQSVQYIPSSPTPSVQEVDPPPLQVCINPPAEGGPYPLLSPGSAKTIIRIGSNEEFGATAQAVAYRLVATVQHHTVIVEQHLTTRQGCANQLAGVIQQCKAEIHQLRECMGNINMPYEYKHNNR